MLFIFCRSRLNIDVGSAHTRQGLANTDTKGYGCSSLEEPDGSALATRIAPGPGECAYSGFCQDRDVSIAVPFKLPIPPRASLPEKLRNHRTCRIPIWGSKGGPTGPVLAAPFGRRRQFDLPANFIADLLLSLSRCTARFPPLPRQSPRPVRPRKACESVPALPGRAPCAPLSCPVHAGKAGVPVQC